MVFACSHRYMGHFSRFVPPGSRRIDMQNPLDATGNGGDSKGRADGSLESVAFLTPNHLVVVVVLNRNDEEIEYALHDLGSSRCTAVLTAKPHSIATLYYAVA